MATPETSPAPGAAPAADLVASAAPAPVAAAATGYVPSDPKAWGPKGPWANKSFDDISYEAQVAQTKTAVGFDGRIIPGMNWEARGSEEDSTYVPKIIHIAPRPAGWKPPLPPSVNLKAHN